MKKNPLALSVYRKIKAANDEVSAAGSPTAAASTQRPAGQRAGWDPFEVWRTRIRPGAGRETRGQS